MRLRWLALTLIACSSTPSAPSSTPPPPAAQPGQWHTGTPLPEQRFEAYAVTLNGEIYYLGGITNLRGEPIVSSRVNVFDPATGSWSDAAPLPPDGPNHHISVAVVGNLIYTLGGFVGIIGGPVPGSFQPVAATFVFDGSTWRRLADQPIARGAATAQAIDGKIYVAGGGNDDTSTRNELYVYDPASDAWTQRASLSVSREHLASCTVGGKMAVVGGWSGPNKDTTSAAELYDPATDTWTRLPDMPTSRGGLGGVVLDGICHFIGGERWDIPPPGTFPVNDGLDLASGSWSGYAPMPTARHGAGIAVLGGAIYVIAGGPEQGNSYTDVVEIFTP
jgi:N-acetylneuraminic acid mutarotase